MLETLIVMGMCLTAYPPTEVPPTFWVQEVEEGEYIGTYELTAYTHTGNNCADELGISEETLHRRGHRGRMMFSWGEIGAIAQSCGYKIYIEKPDVRIDITDLMDEEENADGKTEDT